MKRYNENMNNDSSELIEYLGQRFDKIDSDIMSIKEDTGSLKEDTSSIKEDIAYLKENKADKSDINDLLNAVDAYAKKADTYFQEMVMLSHKVDRHEKWFHLVAEKLGIKLEY